MDITVIIFASPVILLGTLFMVLWSLVFVRGPILFKQNRVGQGEQLFPLYKFRTMSALHNEKRHQSLIKHLIKSNLPLQKLDEIESDSFYPGARLIRAIGLDELPQTLNILRGEMSLVGPRPCLERELEFFDKSRRERFQVLPGLTGKWQVSGKNDLRFQEMLDFDESYTRNQSLAGDFSILARTFPVLLQQATRYFGLTHDELQTAALRSLAAKDLKKTS